MVKLTNLEAPVWFSKFKNMSKEKLTNLTKQNCKFLFDRLKAHGLSTELNKIPDMQEAVSYGLKHLGLLPDDEEANILVRELEDTPPATPVRPTVSEHDELSELKDMVRILTNNFTHFKTKMETLVSTLETKVSKTEDELTAARAQITELVGSKIKTAKEVMDLKKYVTSSQSPYKDMLLKQKDLSTKVQNLEQAVKDTPPQLQPSNLDVQEQLRRGQNQTKVCFYNMPSASGNPYKEVNQILDTLGVSKEVVMLNAFRINTTAGGKPGPVLVTLNSVAERRAVLQAGRNLKGSAFEQVRMSAALTKQQQSLKTAVWPLFKQTLATNKTLPTNQRKAIKWMGEKLYIDGRYKAPPSPPTPPSPPHGNPK